MHTLWHTLSLYRAVGYGNDEYAILFKELIQGGKAHTSSVQTQFTSNI